METTEFGTNVPACAGSFSNFLELGDFSYKNDGKQLRTGRFPKYGVNVPACAGSSGWNPKWTMWVAKRPPMTTRMVPRLKESDPPKHINQNVCGRFGALNWISGFNNT